MKCNIVGTVISGYGDLRFEFGLLCPLTKLYFVVKWKVTMFRTTIKIFFNIWGFKAGAKTRVARERRVEGAAALCACVCQRERDAALSLSPSRSPRGWHLSEVPQVALNYAGGPSCQGWRAKCDTRHWLPLHAPLQPDRRLRHFGCSAAAALLCLFGSPAAGRGPAARICSPCPPAGPGSCDPPAADGAVPQPSPLPRAAPRQNLGGPFQCVCKDNKTPTGSAGGLRSLLLPEKGHCQRQTTSATWLCLG